MIHRVIRWLFRVQDEPRYIGLASRLSIYGSGR